MEWYINLVGKVVVQSLLFIYASVNVGCFEEDGLFKKSKCHCLLRRYVLQCILTIIVEVKRGQKEYEGKIFNKNWNWWKRCWILSYLGFGVYVCVCFVGMVCIVWDIDFWIQAKNSKRENDGGKEEVYIIDEKKRNDVN